MHKLCTKISSIKRILGCIEDILDAIYSEMQKEITAKRQELKELEKEFRKINSAEPFKEKIINKIMQRMIYLNRTKPCNDRIDELARLLDWIEENSDSD